jgi:hypothetical protein
MRSEDPDAAISRETRATRGHERGVAAVSDSDGIVNCGADLVRPTANVNAPAPDARRRDDAPDDEVPTLPEVLSGTSSSSALPASGAEARRLRMRSRVGDRHDREARLDRLGVDEDLRRGRIDDDARRRAVLRSAAWANAAAGSERRRGDPRRRHRALHRTRKVNGAVRTWPSTRHWRKSRHVPATGTRTPTESLPGVDDVPVTLALPSRLVQPLAPGAHTCVWN